MSDTSAESTGIDVPVCAKCGAPIELYGGTGPTLMTSDSHAVGLTTLLSGKIDGYRCEHCGMMLPLWPTMIVRFVEANVFEMVQGSQFADAGKAAKDSADAEIHVWATVPELRAAVLNRMAPAIRTAGEILGFGRDTDRMLGYVDERWRELTPEVFTVGLLAITGRIPGVEVRYAEGADARESESFGVEMLAAAQARVWLRLTLDWSERKPPFARTLEQDLGRYVSLDADLRTAATWLNRFLEGFPDTLSLRDRYLLEALRAYVSYAAEIPTSSPTGGPDCCCLRPAGGRRRGCPGPAVQRRVGPCHGDPDERRADRGGDPAVRRQGRRRGARRHLPPYGRGHPSRGRVLRQLPGRR